MISGQVQVNAGKRYSGRGGKSRHVTAKLHRRRGRGRQALLELLQLLLVLLLLQLLLLMFVEEAEQLLTNQLFTLLLLLWVQVGFMEAVTKLCRRVYWRWMRGRYRRQARHRHASVTKGRRGVGRVVEQVCMTRAQLVECQQGRGAESGPSSRLCQSLHQLRCLRLSGSLCLCLCLGLGRSLNGLQRRASIDSGALEQRGQGGDGLRLLGL